MHKAQFINDATTPLTTKASFCKAHLGLRFGLYFRDTHAQNVMIQRHEGSDDEHPVRVVMIDPGHCNWHRVGDSHCVLGNLYGAPPEVLKSFMKNGGNYANMVAGRAPPLYMTPNDPKWDSSQRAEEAFGWGLLLARIFFPVEFKAYKDSA